MIVIISKLEILLLDVSSILYRTMHYYIIQMIA